LGVTLRLLALFSGATFGAILSAPIMQVAIDFFSIQYSASSQGATKLDQLSVYYNAIIILLLTLIPVILVFTYFYIKGASEEHATEAARTASRERIESLRHELISNQSQIAWSMSEYIYPVVQRQTEQYLQEREGEPEPPEPTGGRQAVNRSEIAASTVASWLQSLEANDEIDEQLRQRLEESLNDNPPDLKGD
jgi:dolichyl-phosphate-mannose--protein O-mannosyl transferase